MQVRAEDFERLDARYAAGTSQIVSRGEVRTPVPGEDPLAAYVEGDLIGRLITLFGWPDPDGGFVLRHRASGLVITAYSAQSGPSYGGGPRWPDRLPEDPLGDDRHEREAQRRREVNAERLAAILAERDALFTAARAGTTPLSAEALCALDRRIAELTAPEGYVAIVSGLEALLATVPLTDYERVEESSEGARRVGVRGGVPFAEDLDPLGSPGS